MNLSNTLFNNLANKLKLETSLLQEEKFYVKNLLDQVNYLKKLKLKYSKVLNGTTLKIFKSSIYKNLSPIICGFVVFINPNFKTTGLKLSSVKKDLKPSFELISVKLNNKMYSTSQLKGLNALSYKQNVFNLHKSLDRHLKTSYILTKKN